MEHFSVAERVARGKAARAEVPRSSHAEWEPAPVRASPVELLEEQAQTRVPELVPIRYGRMLVSPFTFYRGAAYLMASDLAGMPRTGLHAQLCGDAHLSNFGAFAAPDRRLVFSINDFDETLPGPFEWDVKRLVASFAVAGRDRGFSDKERSGVNVTVGQAYREAIARFRGMTNLDLWYTRVDADEVLGQWRKGASAEQLKRADRNVAKTRSKDSLRAFGKLTEIVDGEPRIISDPPVVVPIEDVAAVIGRTSWRSSCAASSAPTAGRSSGDRRKLLERYRYVHAARKVVGVGSVGTRAYIMLLLGRDGDDPLFLQFKEAEASVLEPFLGKSEFANHGQRVVEGQRLTQAASDIMLGWIRAEGIDHVKRDFYVRQLWDAQGIRDRRADGAQPDDHVRQGLRHRAGPSARPLRRRDRDRQLPRHRTTASTAPWPSSPKSYADQNESDYTTLATPSRPDRSKPKPASSCQLRHQPSRLGTHRASDPERSRSSRQMESRCFFKACGRGPRDSTDDRERYRVPPVASEGAGSNRVESAPAGEGRLGCGRDSGDGPVHHGVGHDGDERVDHAGRRGPRTRRWWVCRPRSRCTRW